LRRLPVEVVTATVEKGAGPEALIEALEQHLHHCLIQQPSGTVKLVPIESAAVD